MCDNNCERSEPLVCSMAWIFAVYIFQAIHRAINVLNVSTWYLNIRPM